MAQDAEKTLRCVAKFNGVVWYIFAFEKKNARCVLQEQPLKVQANKAITVVSVDHNIVCKRERKQKTSVWLQLKLELAACAWPLIHLSGAGVNL